MPAHHQRPRSYLGPDRLPGRAVWAVLALLSIMLAACTGLSVRHPTATPAPTATLAPTDTPLPTWTPTPVPTATPIPPAELHIRWPERVSPLAPVPVAVDLVAPPGMAVIGRLHATVMDPDAKVYAEFDLSEHEGDTFRAPQSLGLPLTPLRGYWWLIVHTEASLPVVGDPAVYFEVEPVAFRALTGTLPAAVTLQVPVAFEEVVALGDTYAGGRVWVHLGGEVGLWWAPGPAEALSANNALVILESTQVEDPRGEVPPAVAEVTETTWQGRPAFEFPETWPDGGTATAWVIQGEDDWLYVLRVRAVDGEAPPQVVAEVAQTFGFVAAGE